MTTPLRRTVPLRGLRYHVREWGAEAPGTPVLLLHGWMDNGATFAPLAQELEGRRLLAPDWRGFADTDPAPCGSYWIPDYLADLDGLIERLAPEQPVDLVGHSLGGNMAGLYAGVRPQQVRRLVSIEGFGLAARPIDAAPVRFAEWLDSLQRPLQERTYPSAADLAERLCRRHPGLTAARAAEVAALWTEPCPDGVRLRADPAHWRPNPILYRLEETLACWRGIRAPTLWVYGGQSRYARSLQQNPDWNRRREAIADLRCIEIPESGHAPHLSHPEALCALLRPFLDGE